MTAELSPDRGKLTVSVPLAIRQCGGRKQVVSPIGARDWAPRQAQVDSTLVRALARAFLWRRMLESGTHGSIAELAAAEQINASYLARVLRLTLLAPVIVEAVMNGTASTALTMARTLRPFPVDWQEQRRALGTL